MRASELSELAAFVSVAQTRNFRLAGLERGVTASAISHAVTSLEERVGVRLLNRTTRSVSLTDAGDLLNARLAPAFLEIRDAVDSLNQFRDAPFGTVRINVPHSIGRFVLGKVIGPLIRNNPALRLEVIATDRMVDIVNDGFDAGIRLGGTISQDMVGVKLRPRLRLVVVGSPEYFETRPLPQLPQDLRQHTCIQNVYPSGISYPWEFEKDGERFVFEPSGPLALDDNELMIEAVLGGGCLGYVWEGYARPYIEAGRLVQCLDDWCAPEDWLYLYYPNRRHVSAAMRALIEAIKA